MEVKARTFEGRVVQVLGSYSQVRDDQGQILPCLLRGNLREQAGEDGIRNPVAVGDRVVVTCVQDEGMIEEVLPRHSALQKRVAGDRELGQVVVANVDQLLVVVAARKPTPKTRFIDRLLVAAETGHLQPVIILNKVDLVRGKDAQRLARFDHYQQIGIPVLKTSADTGVGVEAVKEQLKDRVSVFAGPSGVGKSSLLNTIQPGLQLATGQVSQRWNKGRHVTTRVTLLELEGGGYVADTPGVRGFGLWEVDATQLQWGFREFKQHLQECRFNNCLHTVEPHCAVQAAVAAGEIPSFRYESYQRILESLGHAEDAD